MVVAATTNVECSITTTTTTTTEIVSDRTITDLGDNSYSNNDNDNGQQVSNSSSSSTSNSNNNNSKNCNSSSNMSDTTGNITTTTTTTTTSTTTDTEDIEETETTTTGESTTVAVTVTAAAAAATAAAVPSKSAVSQRNVDIKIDKTPNMEETTKQLTKKVLKLDLGNKNLDEYSLKSPKSPIAARLPHQTSLTSSVDVEDRKTLREALYQGIFHRHRRTIFAVGSFLRMLRSRNSQYNTIRSSSEGEDIDEVR